MAEIDAEVASLISNAKALLDLDKDGALVPHGIGGHAHSIIKALVAAIEQRDQIIAGLLERLQSIEASCALVQNDENPDADDLLVVVQNVEIEAVLGQESIRALSEAASKAREVVK